MAKAPTDKNKPAETPALTTDDSDDGGIGHNSIEVDLPQIEAWIVELEGLKKAVSEKNGKLRNELKRILEQSGYNETAFADIRKIKGMSPSRRKDYLETFKPVLDAFYEAEWKNEHRDLVDDMKVGDGSTVS